MTEDQNLSLIWGVGALVLVASALFARRIGFGEILRTSLAWIAIFAVFVLIFSYKDQILGVWEHVSAEVMGKNDQRIDGTSLRIRQSADGHYWVDALVNNKPVRFLIDSGATTTAMNINTAIEAEVDIPTIGFPVILSTANGDVEAKRATIQNLQIGSMTVQSFPVVVSEAFGDTNVIGMNFLSKLESWRVEGNVMVLIPSNDQ